MQIAKTTRPVIPAVVWALSVLCAGAGRAQDELDDPAARAELVVKLVENTIRLGPRSTSVLAGIDPRRAPGEVRRMARIIRETRFDVSLEEQELEVVLDLLRQVSGLNFSISKSARERLAAETPRISMKLRDISLENMLNLMRLQLGSYRFTIRYGTVMLVTREEYRPRPVLRVYDISDIVRQRRDFRAPKLGLQGIIEEP